MSEFGSVSVALLPLALVAAGGGAWSARRRGAVPVRGLARLAAAVATLAALWALAARLGWAPLLHLRFLGFAAPVAWAAATFAASVMVLAGARPPFADTSLALRIGRRLLLSQQAQVVSTVSRIAVLGVSLGVWLVLVALGILGGFERDLVDKLRGSGADLTVERVGGDAWALAPAGADNAHVAAAVAKTALRALPLARAATPYVATELAVASGSNYAGAWVQGLVPSQAAAAAPLWRALPAATLAALDAPCAPQCPVVLGTELARNLAVGPGDNVRLISPVGEVLTPVGVAPRSVGARVVGIVNSKVYDTDSRVVLTRPELVQQLLGWPTGTFSGLQVAARLPERVEALSARAPSLLAQALATQAKDLLATDWKTRNQTLFAALELERVVAAVVLAFILLVASFSIVNTLSMSIRERRHEVAMLRAMGASTALILQVFLGQGMLIGGIGTAVGAILGTGTLALLSRFGFGIPYEVYYIDALPVDMAWSGVVGVVAAALLMLWDFAVVPSSQAARLRPAEGLRDG